MVRTKSAVDSLRAAATRLELGDVKGCLDRVEHAIGIIDPRWRVYLASPQRKPRMFIESLRAAVEKERSMK